MRSGLRTTAIESDVQEDLVRFNFNSGSLSTIKSKNLFFVNNFNATISVFSRLCFLRRSGSFQLSPPLALSREYPLKYLYSNALAEFILLRSSYTSGSILLPV